MSLKIIGTGKGIPKKSITNNELSTIVDTNDEWISSRTGIRSRFVCTDESLTDLCVTAAGSALEKAGLTANDIDLILCSTIGGDYVTPSLACTVAERMGTNCPAFDINAACAGFIYALDVASMYLSSEKMKNILIICAEMMSKHADWADRSTCVLFGDGAGACVVTKGGALKYANLTANGNVKLLNLKSGTGNSPFACEKKETGYLHMEGPEVFKFAVSMIESQARLAFETLGLSPDDIDYFVLHQANKRIIESARTRLKQPQEKFPINISRYGNMSSATIPILLDEMLGDGKIKKGDKILMSAFGAGLTTGTCIMIWE
ncbi:MAG: beta-ketoacyl-ACP synthase III [Oscillospiraceae bacterium]